MSNSADEPLKDARYTLRHAGRHITAFEEVASPFLNGNPCITVAEVHPVTSETLHKIRLQKAMPDALNGIAFDAVQNLRASLDQACYAVTPTVGKKAKQTHFPFGHSQQDAEGRRRGNGKSAAIPEELFRLLVDRFRPYRGGDDLLWSLNELCNINKHRMVSPTAVGASIGGGVGIAHVTAGAPVVILPPVWDFERNEMVLARVPRGSRLTFRVDYTVSVRFVSDLECLRERAADGVLRTLEARVRHILDAIEHHVAGVGFEATAQHRRR